MASTPSTPEDDKIAVIKALIANVEKMAFVRWSGTTYYEDLAIRRMRKKLRSLERRQEQRNTTDVSIRHPAG